jgi:hypothetical protein
MVRTGFGRGRFPRPPITPLCPHPRSLGAGSRRHTHHIPHSHFKSGRYTLELSSDPHGLRRTVPSAPVFPCTPTPFRDVSAGPRVVRGSTVARRPSVRLITHIFVGRVSRFSCRYRYSIPSWPVPMSPKPGNFILNTCGTDSTAFSMEWGRRGFYIPQRPVVAAPAHFYACGFSSLLPWQGRASDHPVCWHRVVGLAASDTVQ